MSGRLGLRSRSLVVIDTASICWAFNFGVGTPLASLWLQQKGHCDTIIGLNTAAHYLGIAVAAGLVPWAMSAGATGVLHSGCSSQG